MAEPAAASMSQDGDELELLRFALESAAEGLIVVDADRKILFANSAAAAIFGVTAEELKGTTAPDPRLNLVGEDGAELGEEERMAIVSAQEGFEQRETIIGIRWPRRAKTLWVVVRSALFGADAARGRRPRVIITLKDITERKVAVDRLANRVRILNAINSYSLRLEDEPFDRMYALIADASRSIFGANVSAVAVYDEPRKTLVLQEISWSPGLEEGTVGHFRSTVMKGLATPVGAEEYAAMMGMKVGVYTNLHEFSFGVVPKAVSDGIESSLGIGWFRGMVLASHDRLFGGIGLAGAKGEPPPEPGELSVFAAITANTIMRKKAEAVAAGLLKEKELFLREVHHRIKNNMSTMTSILSIHAGSVSEPAAQSALKDAASRFQSMNSLYDQLFLQENLRDMPITGYLSALAREIVGIFPSGAAVEVEARGPDTRLGVRKLSAVGIIANEILTNSMKYAFIGRRTGRISLALSLRESRVILEIGDDGVGMPENACPEPCDGFGLKLIDVMAKQIGASVSVDRRHGTRYTIEFDRG